MDDGYELLMSYDVPRPACVLVDMAGDNCTTDTLQAIISFSRPPCMFTTAASISRNMGLVRFPSWNRFRKHMSQKMDNAEKRSKCICELIVEQTTYARSPVLSPWHYAATRALSRLTARMLACLVKLPRRSSPRPVPRHPLYFVSSPWDPRIFGVNGQAN